MKRVMIQVDLEDNEILNKSIDEAIEAVVKTKTRDVLNKTIDSIVSEAIEKKIFESDLRYGFLRDKVLKIAEGHLESKIKTEMLNKVDYEFCKPIIEAAVLSSSKTVNINTVMKEYVDKIIEKQLDEKITNNFIKTLMEKWKS